MSDTNNHNKDFTILMDTLRTFVPMLDIMTDPIIVFSDLGEILAVNNAAQSLFKIGETHPPLDAIIPEQLLAHIHGKQLLNEWEFDEDHWFIPRTYTVDMPDLQHPRVLVLRDISQFKKINRNQNEFMRIVAHDLRSPLTSMKGFASMLELGLVGELNEKQTHFVGKILSGISQLTLLVENIQDAGRFDPDTGFYELMRSQVDVADLLREVVQDYLVPAEKGELTIHTSIADDVPIISADANMLERAIANLVDNAIKYTPNGGSVKVSVYTKDRAIIVAVTDSGLGISAENQALLFQRHMRIARQEHKKIKGSGLGLFIVKSVAQRHGGTAKVESKEGQGSTFYMTIPLDGDNQLF